MENPPETQTSSHSLTQRGASLQGKQRKRPGQLPKALSEMSEEASTSLLQTTKIFLKGSGLKIKQTNQRDADWLWPSPNNDNVGNNIATFRHFKRGIKNKELRAWSPIAAQNVLTLLRGKRWQRYTQPRAACNQGLYHRSPISILRTLLRPAKKGIACNSLRMEYPRIKWLTVSGKDTV